MIIIGRIVLLALFVLAVYLPLRGWHSWRGGWRYLALLPVIPLAGLGVYVADNVFLDTGEELSPELMVLVVIGSLLMSAVIGFFQGKK